MKSVKVESENYQMGDNETCLKFIHILQTIVKEGGDVQNAVSALKCFTEFLKADTMLRMNFKPTYQTLQSLNLFRLMSKRGNVSLSDLQQMGRPG